MSQLRLGLLPFDDVDAKQFESFVLQFLGAGISLAVIRRTEGSEEAKATRHKIVSASLYGPPGKAGQDGIDIRVVTETGEVWAFQCKHYARSTFTETMAAEAVKLAEEKYPEATRYFVIMSREPTPVARREVERHAKWEIWGGSELSTRFLNEVDRSKQIEILRRVFAGTGDALVARLYPLHDDPLVAVGDFFSARLKKGELFHHRADLVGRVQALQALDDFVEDAALQVCILPARGGVGKTRLLRAFGETFEAKHAGRKVLFVDPAALPNLGSDRLRAAKDAELIVVQDDAHRTESLRAELAASLFQKEGKLLLAARPQGIEALQAWLARLGVDPRRIKVLPALPPLGRDDMVRLANASLPDDKKSQSLQLAEMAKGCALIVTVGAVLIAEDQGAPGTWLDSAAFQRAVFERLEQEAFGVVPVGTNTRLLRETLRLLAVLAPWQERMLSLNAMAGVLECTAREAQVNCDYLRAAGLLVMTREGWRVIPDLLADHLVYQACYDEHGRLTTFARKLQQALAGAASGTMLRNLAEAEWQAQLQGRHIESLLDPFWHRIREQFVAGNHFDRFQLVQQWQKFAAYQPGRSLELARLAMAGLPPGATPEQYAQLSVFEPGQVLGALPGLLEPIAIYHQVERRAALDLLWDLHEQHGKIEEQARNDPLNAIARVAKFQIRHPVNTSLEVVQWLADKLNGPEAARICDQPSAALATMLKPVFDHDVEDNYSTGNTVHFRSVPISVANTRVVREATLKLLREQVIPRGEVATLNALGVMTAALDTVRLRWVNVADDGLQQQWLPDRLAALSLVEALVTPGQSARVFFRIARLLRPHAARDSVEKFREECTRVVGLVPDSTGLRLTRVLVSSAWEEFYHDKPREEQIEANAAKSEVEMLWEDLATGAAGEFREAHPTPREFIAGCERVAREYQAVGMPAQFSDFFRAIRAQSEDFAYACLDELFGKDTSPVDYWWTSFLPFPPPVREERVQAWIKLVLRKDNPVRWRPLQYTLRWGAKQGLPEGVLVEVSAWAARLTDATLGELIAHLQYRSLEDKPMDEAVLSHLNLAGFSDDSLMKIADALSRFSDQHPAFLPEGFAERFIGELGRVRSLDSFDEKEFLDLLAKRRPKLFFDMLRQRVGAATPDRKGKGFSALPLNVSYLLEELTGLPEYGELSREVFQELRASTEETRWDWIHLFQVCVLRVSPLGLQYLVEWLEEATTIGELEAIIDLMKFEGSLIIFRQPLLVKTLLRKLLRIAPADFGKWSWELGNTAAPRTRGYTGHQLDPEFTYYREEAVQAVSAHANDAELVAFYREIVRAEDEDMARQQRWAALELSDEH